MADKREEILDDDFLIEMTDDEGNVFYYVEEMIIPVDGENFALLVEVKDEEHVHGANCDCGCDCDCGCEDDDVIIAKIVVNEDGLEEYIEPTDEEFEKVQAAYEKLLDEET
ncbi:MAG: DUF1292 domain-containing protein [Selenomonadaceae bacterium]|nr:DUF1292 domain-containing protein [Selenomonadaceae bacterium]